MGKHFLLVSLVYHQAITSASDSQFLSAPLTVFVLLISTEGDHFPRL